VKKAKSGMNKNLYRAKRAKNDEFYTQYSDIQKEVEVYVEYNPDVFRGKVIYCNCDDPSKSNFVKFFKDKFKEYGLKKLIATGCKISSDIETLGDFRSDECIDLLKQSDIVITNPPFSLFREYVKQLFNYNKKFVIIGNKNVVTYKGIFPLIKDNKMWSGKTGWSGGLWFITMNDNNVDRVINGVNMKNVSSVWFTNLDHGRRHQPLSLMTMKENLKYSKHKQIKGKKTYDKYDNYNAIEVPFTDAIPSDYRGVMGVPISFLDKYNPEQFKIIGIDRYVKDNPKYGKRFSVGGREKYARILIKHKRK